MICNLSMLNKISDFISVCMSLLGSIIIMLTYNFLSYQIMIFILVLCIIMYLIGYKVDVNIDGIISKMKK